MSLHEGFKHLEPPFHVYLKTTDDVVVHRTLGFSHRGRYYGSSAIGERVTQAVVLPAGSEVHYLPGGWFAIDGDDVYEFSPHPADTYDGRLADRDGYIRLFGGKAVVISQRRKVVYPTGIKTLPDFTMSIKEV